MNLLIASSEGEGPPRTFLLVEDNAADAHLIKFIFEVNQLPGTVYWVTDGVQALDFVNRRGPCGDAPRPSMILLDLNLPRKHGIEVLDELQQSDTAASIPVVILSTSERNEDRAQCMSRNAVKFLSKPKDLSSFEAIIKQLILVDFPALEPPRTTPPATVASR